MSEHSTRTVHAVGMKLRHRIQFYSKNFICTRGVFQGTRAVVSKSVFKNNNEITESGHNNNKKCAEGKNSQDRIREKKYSVRFHVW